MSTKRTQIFLIAVDTELMTQEQQLKFFTEFVPPKVSAVMEHDFGVPQKAMAVHYLETDAGLKNISFGSVDMRD